MFVVIFIFFAIGDTVNSFPLPSYQFSLFSSIVCSCFKNLNILVYFIQNVFKFFMKENLIYTPSGTVYKFNLQSVGRMNKVADAEIGNTSVMLWDIPLSHVHYPYEKSCNFFVSKFELYLDSPFFQS